MPTFVGIDIAARSFKVAVRKAGQPAKISSFEQTAQDHAKLVRQLTKLAPKRIVMEATGIYYLDLAVALHQAGLPVSVINPKSFRHFAQLKLTSSKTDPIDSALLAEYAERMEPTLWVCPSPSQLVLRQLGRQINRMTAARAKAKNRLHALQATQTSFALLIEDEKEGIATLNRRIERLKKAALELIGQDATLSAHLEHFIAAKGIAEASAIALLAELCVLPTHLKASQVSRYAGLDVRLTQSGTSLNRPGRLSKTGNAYLRSALFMPTRSAAQHDVHAKAFYQTLVKRGKKKIQAQCALMRKYLTGLWACMRDNSPFDSSALFDTKQILS